MKASLIPLLFEPLLTDLNKNRILNLSVLNGFCYFLEHLDMLRCEIEKKKLQTDWSNIIFLPKIEILNDIRALNIKAILITYVLYELQKNI